jgi:hypothetical protein
MVGISKGMVAVAALVAFGIVTVDDMARGLATPAQSYAQTQDATADHIVLDGALRDRAAAALRTLTERQEANRAATEAKAWLTCHEQSWPYYSNDCLVRSDSAEVMPVVRIVRIERLAGELQ